MQARRVAENANEGKKDEGNGCGKTDAQRPTLNAEVEEVRPKAGPRAKEKVRRKN
jgi:hypothetical protein